MKVNLTPVWYKQPIYLERTASYIPRRFKLDATRGAKFQAHSCAAIDLGFSGQCCYCATSSRSFKQGGLDPSNFSYCIHAMLEDRSENNFTNPNHIWLLVSLSRALAACPKGAPANNWLVKRPLQESFLESAPYFAPSFRCQFHLLNSVLVPVSDYVAGGPCLFCLFEMAFEVVLAVQPYQGGSLDSCPLKNPGSRLGGIQCRSFIWLSCALLYPFISLVRLLNGSRFAAALLLEESDLETRHMGPQLYVSLRMAKEPDRRESARRLVNSSRKVLPSVRLNVAEGVFLALCLSWIPSARSSAASFLSWFSLRQTASGGPILC
ncbi:uncharacterized protein BDR25DRAFT_361335 [Lindgomyces ingoldianus]|uniref:Uncharacterized protein n=1 Tax=Lindgomyces ingoldianus TaxID=673940 RepID=A0ACB6QF67_9PLEO|nr:uncharacterized protein BDR25DRAFT_361335 [Lindgomyces ingoldianus]KAF2464795.1 hypothetical protein BDR25DRAFT_361335 [Lindgomyces ingoldianus]